MLNGCSFETERISVMRGSKRVIVKMVLFQFRGNGQAQDDALTYFLPDSKSSILGLSNNVSFVSEFLCENSQKEKFLTLADPEKGRPSNLRWSQNRYQFHQTSLKFHY